MVLIRRSVITGPGYPISINLSGSLECITHTESRLSGGQVLVTDYKLSRMSNPVAMALTLTAPKLWVLIKALMNSSIVLHETKFGARKRGCGHLVTLLETSPSPRSHRQRIKLLQPNER